MVSATPALRLPSQQQSVIAHWPLLNYTCLVTREQGCEQLAHAAEPTTFR